MENKMRKIHPGELLKEEIMEPNKLTVTQTAALLGVTRPTISAIVNEKQDITPEMALRIAQVFGGSPDLWVSLQAKYNLKKAMENSKLKLAKYKYEKEKHDHA